MVNVVGLTIGLTAFLLVLLYAQHELTTEDFHQSADQIYRVHTVQEEEAGNRWSNRTPALLAPELTRQSPKVENAVRLQYERPVLSSQSHQGKPDALYRTDASFFQIFDFPLEEGNPTEVLDSPNSIVLSRDLARKHFPETEAVGKTISLRGAREYVVTGVAGSMPSSSHLKFDALASWDSTGTRDWDKLQSLTYVLLRENAIPSDLDPVLSPLQRRVSEETGRVTAFHLQALPQLHLYNLRGEIDWAGNGGQLILFGFVGAFILIMACVNYTSLATAQAHGRASEVGVRKASGASRGQVARQFLIESVCLSAIAGVLSIAAAVAMLPVFNAVLGVTIAATDVFTPAVSAGYVSCVLVTGMVAGGYPAFVLASLNPAQVLKGGNSTSGFSAVQRGIVVFQFSLAILLTIGTTTIWNQLSYLQSKPLGFESDGRIVLRAYSLASDHESVAAKLEQRSDVHSVGATSCVPGVGSFEATTVRLGQSTEAAGSTLELATFRCSGGPGTIDALGLRLKEGRNLRSTDQGRAVLVNQTAAQRMREKLPGGVLGSDVTWRQAYWTKENGEWERRHETRSAKVVGVVADYHFASVREHIQPLLIQYDPGRLDNFVVYADSDSKSDLRAHLESYWQQRVPGKNFEYQAMGGELTRSFAQEQRRQMLTAVFAVLAMLLASLGLFGLAAYVTGSRRKEIAVRKCLGASTRSVLALMTVSFVKLVAVSVALALPVAWVVVQQWLGNFAYHSGPSVLVFGGSVALALGIAVCTVAFWTYRTAQVDPASSLRSADA
jgi:putative ABC transport system permease protein